MTTVFMILLAIILAVISTFLMINFIINKMVIKKLNDKDDIKNSISINVLKATLFISVSLLINELNLSLQNLTNALSNNNGTSYFMLEAISYFSIFILIFMLSYICIFVISYILFSVIFRGKDIFIETINNNFGLVIFFIGLYLMLVLAFKPNMLPIFDYFIAYPTISIH
jgi:hypothetical protein